MKLTYLAAFSTILSLAGCGINTPRVSCTCYFGQVAPPGIRPGCEQDLIADVGARVFFDFDSSQLSNDAHATLKRQSAWLAKYPNVNVLVAGNADERGTEMYNLALGQRRANAARDYLVAEGVSESRIQTISYGKDCPVAAGTDEASYQQNRDAITSVQGFNPQNCH